MDNLRGTDATKLIEQYNAGQLDDSAFLTEFGKAEVWYSTPAGDLKDGGKALFLIPKPNGSRYLPVFSTPELMKEAFEQLGRVNYMILQGTFESVLETTQKINDSGTPVKMGIIIDFTKDGITLEAEQLDMVLGLMKG